MTFLPLIVPVDDDPYLDELVLDQFLGNLAVGYTMASSPGEELLTWADLEHIGMPHRAVRSQALGYLNANLDRARLHGQPPALMLSFDGLESTILLADAFWDRLEGTVPGEIVVGVPTRDVVIVTGSQSLPGLEKARRAVDRVFFANDQYLLTRHLLVRRQGVWEVFGPLVPRQRTPRATGVPR